MKAQSKRIEKMSQNRERDEQYGLVIPIAILIGIYLLTGVGWLFIPIVVLLCVLCGNVREDAQIRKSEEEIHYWKAPEPGVQTSGYIPDTVYDGKPIYDRRRQKEQGTDFGILIPIFILGVVYVLTGVGWIFIPIAVLLIMFICSFFDRSRNSAQVREHLYQDDVETIPDIASRTGMSEEKVRRYIVDQKRSGESGIWFDPTTGTKVSAPAREVSPERTERGCPYCGFALKEQDRFCPFCGAPIRAGT
jgi:hypothetical protein